MSSSKQKFPGIGDPPKTNDTGLMQWMNTVTDVIRQGTGQTGKASWLTWDKLEDSDVVEPVKRKQGSAAYPPGQGQTGEGSYVVKPPIDRSPPPAPRNVVTSGSPTTVRILWDNPHLNYSYRAEVYIGDVNDVGQAVLAGSSNGTIYQHDMGSDTSKKFFWVRFVKGTGRETITGPWNQTAGTPGKTAGELKNEQLGQLDVDKLIGGTGDFVEANIRDGSITNAMIGDTIQSDNYQPGRQGWIIKK